MWRFPRVPTPLRPMRTRSAGESPTGAARNGDHQGNSASSVEEPATTARRLRNSRRCARPEPPEEDEDNDESESIFPLDTGNKLPRVGMINNLNRRDCGESGDKGSPVSLRSYEKSSREHLCLDSARACNRDSAASFDGTAAMRRNDLSESLWTSHAIQGRGAGRGERSILQLKRVHRI